MKPHWGDTALRRSLTTALGLSLFSAHAAAVDFGDRDPSLDYSKATITIENTTASEVTLTGSPPCSITGTDAADFSVERQPATTTIPAGESVEAKVMFNPSALGARSATLEVPTDNATLGTVTIHKQGFTDTVTGWGALSSPAEEVLADDGEIETVRITDPDPLTRNPTRLLRLAFEMLNP